MKYPKWIWLLIVLSMILVIIGIWARYFHYRAFLNPVYMIASTLFVAIPVIAGGLKNSFGRWITAGLVFCWLGDLQIKNTFLIGVFCFMIAHLLFIVAFLKRGVRYGLLWRTIPIVSLVTAGILAWILPHIPNTELFSILVYATVISLMAMAAFTLPYGEGNRILYWAAALFFISDAALAFSRFIPSMKSWIYLCHPIYYPACLAFALSTFKKDSQDNT